MPTETNVRAIADLAAKKSYTHDDVATLFGVHVTTVYHMPKLMACRIDTGNPRVVRYAREKVDAILSGEPQRKRA